MTREEVLDLERRARGHRHRLARALYPAEWLEGVSDEEADNMHFGDLIALRQAAANLELAASIRELHSLIKEHLKEPA